MNAIAHCQCNTEPASALCVFIIFFSIFYIVNLVAVFMRLSKDSDYPYESKLHFFLCLIPFYMPIKWVYTRIKEL